MCFSVMSRHRAQILMLIFMLFHCSDFAEQPSCSTTSHDSFDFVRLLQTQRSGFAEQSGSSTALHSASNLVEFLQTWKSEAPGSANTSDARTQGKAEWQRHNARLYVRRVSAQMPVHVHVPASCLTTETFEIPLLLSQHSNACGSKSQQQVGFQQCQHSRLRLLSYCHRPSAWESEALRISLWACGDTPQLPDGLCSGCLPLLILRSCESAPKLYACGAPPRRQHDFNAGISCSQVIHPKPGPCPYVCGVTPRQQRVHVTGAACAQLLPLNSCKSEAQRFLSHAVFQTLRELSCVCPFCLELPRHCRGPEQAAFQTLSALSFVCQLCLAFPWRYRGPTELEACGVLPRSQCINRSHISVPAVHRGWC